MEWLLENTKREEQMSVKTRDYVQSLVAGIRNNPDPVEFCNVLTNAEYSHVLDLIRHFKNIATRVPMFANVQMAELPMMTASCLRSAQFSVVLPGMNQFSQKDRALLVRSATLKVSWLRYIIVASNVVSSLWKNKAGSAAHVNPYIFERTLSEDCGKFLAELTEALVDIPLDEPTIIMLISAIYFCSDNNPHLSRADKVSEIQQIYLSILMKYLIWRHGCIKAAVIYPKLVNIITSFRYQKFRSTRVDHNIWFEQREVDFINQVMGELSPCLDYSVEERNANLKENYRLVLPADFQRANTNLRKFMNLIQDRSVKVGNDNLFDLIESLDSSMATNSSTSMNHPHVYCTIR